MITTHEAKRIAAAHYERVAKSAFLFSDTQTSAIESLRWRFLELLEVCKERGSQMLRMGEAIDKNACSSCRASIKADLAELFPAAADDADKEAEPYPLWCVDRGGHLQESRYLGPLENRENAEAVANPNEDKIRRCRKLSAAEATSRPAGSWSRGGDFGVSVYVCELTLDDIADSQDGEHGDSDQSNEQEENSRAESEPSRIAVCEGDEESSEQVGTEHAPATEEKDDVRVVTVGFYRWKTWVHSGVKCLAVRPTAKIADSLAYVEAPTEAEGTRLSVPAQLDDLRDISWMILPCNGESTLGVEQAARHRGDAHELAGGVAPEKMAHDEKGHLWVAWTVRGVKCLTAYPTPDRSWYRCYIDRNACASVEAVDHHDFDIEHIGGAGAPASFDALGVTEWMGVSSSKNPTNALLGAASRAADQRVLEEQWYEEAREFARQAKISLPDAGTGWVKSSRRPGWGFEDDAGAQAEAEPSPPQKTMRRADVYIGEANGGAHVWVASAPDSPGEMVALRGHRVSVTSLGRSVAVALGVEGFIDEARANLVKNDDAPIAPGFGDVHMRWIVETCESGLLLTAPDMFGGTEIQHHAKGNARRFLSKLGHLALASARLASEEKAAPPPPCRRCSDCPDASHHWMPDFDDGDWEHSPEPRPVWGCKHCNFTMPMDADDSEGEHVEQLYERLALETCPMCGMSRPRRCECDAEDRAESRIDAQIERGEVDRLEQQIETMTAELAAALGAPAETVDEDDECPFPPDRYAELVRLVELRIKQLLDAEAAQKTYVENLAEALAQSPETDLLHVARSYTATVRKAATT